MFGFFKKKKEEFFPAVNPEEIHRELLTSSIDYLTISKQQELIAIENIKGIRSQYNSLCNLGLESSKNAKILKAKIDSVNSKITTVNLAKNVVIYIFNLKRTYGPRVFLVSNEAFNNICTKYNLSTGMLKDYCGTIPNENLKELGNYRTIEASHKNLDFLDLTFGFNRDMYYVTSADAISRDEELVKQFLLSVHNIVKAKTNWSCSYLGWCENTPKELSYVSIKGIDIKPNEFFIACPEEYLHSEVNVSINPIDPIVYRECPYGKVVFTMWGKEAEDKVLEEFKKLNNLI